MMTLAIVEDLEHLRTSAVEYFEEVKGIDLLGSFANGEDALRGLQDLNPDVIIMDIGLPGISGLECMATLKGRGLKSSFLMFTVFDQDEYLFVALKLGAAGYILKGEGEEGLLNAINDWKAGGAPMSRAIAQKVIASFQSPPQLSPKQGLETLTVRERDILELVAEGLLNKEIAARLEIAEGTVKQHNYKIYRKLSVNSRGEAIRKYLKK